MKQNYQKILDQTIKQFEEKGEVPALLIHSCCAPCSSYVLEYLSNYFHITVLYYNPNIFPKEEYEYRIMEQERFIRTFPAKYPIHFISTEYTPEEFYNSVKGHEQDKEGEERCRICYELRLRQAANYAKQLGFPYFTTTLSISPMKNAEWLNDIGVKVAKEFDVNYLISDFKKRGGYGRSVELSKEYNLYRQDYCGCVYSKNEREAMKKNMPEKQED